MTFRKEFLPPQKLIKEWGREYWKVGKELGRFPCTFDEYLLMKSAEWGALKIRPVSKKSKGATEVRQGQVCVGRHEQSTIFDFLAPSA
jgi:hypothetical protein